MRIVVAVILLGATFGAIASPQSEASRQAGREALAAGRLADALGHFSAAMNADPQDQEAAFLHGAAANRLGRFSEAEASLARAADAGYRNVELDFERGWAAMGRGQAQPCIEHLERFEANRPGRGQTSEFLGRCALSLGRHDVADAHFARALARDPRLAPTVSLSRAALEQARGRPEAALTQFDLASGADAPTGRALRELAGPAEPVTQPDKPLRLSLSFSVGHNDNVIGLGNTMPLPTDISRKGTAFARLAFGAAWTHQFTSRTAGTLGYALLLDRYSGLASANLNDHYFYGDLFHQATERFALSLRLSAESAELNGRAFRSTTAVRPAVSYRFSPNAVTELSWNHADNDYKTPVAAAFSRDGATQTLGLVHSMRLPGTRWSGALGATLGRNDAQGGDFKSDSLGASATLRYTFANRIVAALGASVGRDDYRNLNSLAGTGSSFARADRQGTLSAQLTGPLSEKLRWFAQLQGLRNHSNIPFYTYRQNVISAGIAAEF